MPPTSAASALSRHEDIYIVVNAASTASTPTQTPVAVPAAASTPTTTPVVASNKSAPAVASQPKSSTPTPASNGSPSTQPKSPSSPAAPSNVDAYRTLLLEDPESVKLAQKFRQLGNDKIAEKDYSKAEAAYTMALSHSLVDPILYSNRSFARLSTKNFTGALEDTDICLTISRENVKALHRRAQALLADTGASDLIKGPLAYVTAERILALPSCDATLRATVSEWKRTCMDTLGKNQPKEAHDQFLAAQTTSATQLVAFFRDPLQAARDAFRGGQYVHSLSIYDQILHLRPDHREALLESGVVWTKAGKFTKALTQFVNLLALHNHSKDQLVQVLLQIVECYLSMKQYQLAYLMTLQALYAHSGSNALHTPPTKNEATLTIRGYMAKALRLKGEPALARRVLIENLQAFEDHVFSLDEYGRVLEALKQPLEALRVYLKMFVLNMHNPDLKEHFAAVMQNKEAFAFFREQMDPATNPEQFYSFIASGVKEFGAVELSSNLYRACLEFKPNHPTYLLNLVHNLEVQNEPQEAYQLLKEHIWTQRNEFVGPLHMAAIWNLIRDVDVLVDHQIWKPKVKAESNGTSNGASGKAPTANGKGKSKTPKPHRELLTVLPGNKNAPKYVQKELDLLATIFTLVKICYIAGVLDILPEICRLTDTACDGRDVHDTIIKNENAYFSCITGLMSYHAKTIENPPSADMPRLYVAGDSHSMTPAWHTMHLRGKDHLVQPLLVTGMKIWHLRPSSRFFPKNNFYNVVPKAPAGSTIVFLFGEIDCREGFLVSVQKCRYKDLEEAAQVTIDIYMDILKSLVETYQYEIFIHPIVPVLDATRHVVLPFMKLLVQTIEKRKAESQPGDWTHNIHMLDFFWKLVKKWNKEAGEPEPEYWGASPKIPWYFEKTYDLDLTHMNPKYLPLLQDALTVSAKEADADPHPYVHQKK